MNCEHYSSDLGLDKERDGNLRVPELNGHSQSYMLGVLMRVSLSKPNGIKGTAVIGGRS